MALVHLLAKKININIISFSIYHTLTGLSPRSFLEKHEEERAVSEVFVRAEITLSNLTESGEAVQFTPKKIKLSKSA